MPTPLDQQSLRAGAVFTRGIFTRRGERLVAAGVTLTQAMRDSLAERATDEAGGEPVWNLFLADGEHEFERDRGRRDPRSGSADRAMSRAATTPEAAHRASIIRDADRAVDALTHVWQELPERAERVPVTLSPAEDEPALWPAPERIARFRELRIQRIERIHTALLRGETVDVEEPASIVADLQTLYWRFPRRFAILADPRPIPDTDNAEAPRHAPLPPSDLSGRVHAHAWDSAVIAVLVGSTLNWEAEDVRIVGLAAVLADVGMHLLPVRALDAPKPLSDSDRNRLWRHPAYSVALLERVEGLPETVRRAAYQHHERLDGSGYPNRLRGRAITDHARVLSVADAYTAAAAARPHRPSRHRYPALNDLVERSTTGAFDRPTVRALTRAVGLFPVGAVVRLSTGEIARVVANHPSAIDRPTVRILRRAAERTVVGPRVDLADFAPGAISIVGPADHPGRTWSLPRPASAA